VPAILTIFIVVIVALALAVDNNDAPPLFAEDLRESLVEVGRAATVFNDTVVGISAVDRVTLVAAVDGVVEALDATEETMATAPPNDPELTAPVAILQEVISSWRRGSTDFRDAVLLAADDPLAIGVDIAVTDSLIDVRAGDRIYELFVESMDRAETPAPVVAFPEIEFVSDTYPFSVGPPQIVELARSPGNNLALQADLAIEGVATAPDMVLNTNDEPVITVTDLVTVQVIVLNRGNTVSEPVLPTMDMVGTDGSTLQEVSEVAALDAGEQTTVAFSDISVVAGQRYEVRVGLPVADSESENDDNTRTVTFTINEETGTTTTAG
jgi:hypothetical protein